MFHRSCIQCLIIIVVAVGFPITTGAAQDRSFITTETSTTLMSVNDGEAGALVSGSGQAVADSVTVINLSPTSAPVIRTVYGLAASTLIGSPHAAIVGRYGIVTNHNMRLDQSRNLVEDTRQVAGNNQVVVIDLQTLVVTDSVRLDAKPWLARGHPDQERVVIGLSDGWLVLRLDAAGVITEQTSSASDESIISFDLS